MTRATLQGCDVCASQRPTRTLRSIGAVYAETGYKPTNKFAIIARWLVLPRRYALAVDRMSFNTIDAVVKL